MRRIVRVYRWLIVATIHGRDRRDVYRSTGTPLISLGYYIPRPPTLLTCFSINNLSGEPPIGFWFDITLSRETSGENAAMEKPRETACSIEQYISLFVGRDCAPVEKWTRDLSRWKQGCSSIRETKIYIFGI